MALKPLDEMEISARVKRDLGDPRPHHALLAR
jgi:hypothetical protein